MDYSKYRGRGRDKTSGVERPLTYLPNETEWVEKIYCVESDDGIYSGDEVLGGVQGVDNAQAQALSNRTNWLYEQMGELETKLNEIDSILSILQVKIAPILSTIKKLAIQAEPVTDWEHYAWWQPEATAEARALLEEIEGKLPTLTFKREDGSVLTNPVLKVTFENGKEFYIRLDGQG